MPGRRKGSCKDVLGVATADRVPGLPARGAVPASPRGATPFPGPSPLLLSATIQSTADFPEDKPPPCGPQVNREEADASSFILSGGGRYPLSQ